MNHAALAGLPTIGLGIDVHRLEAGRRCVLGGITIDSPIGPLGHSDGDAVLHAACDACLGAAGLDDLGSLFPDRDPAHRDRASSEFCVETMQRVHAAGFVVASLDIVVECERPKIAPHRGAIRQNVADLFGLPIARVNVKGKTGEGLDAIGRGEALRATAVALLVRRA